MNKKAYFYIDDVIWLFRDLARMRPKSIYDNAFMKMLKKAHDLYGMKVQLNVFLRTDFYYGNDEFCLSEMPDCYKSEFEEASDWLKFGFHSKQEFPDYPFVNAPYEDVKSLLDETKAEIFRIAGNNSFAYATVPHWLPISKEGCRALYDGGIKILNVSHGEKAAYTGDPFTLPYGHSSRLLHNRQPETMLYRRGTRDVAIDSSICAYNHISSEDRDRIDGHFGYIKDEETGICFKKFTNGPCLNLTPLSELEDDIAKSIGSEYFGYATHEQYFYPDYFAYQPDYPEKVLRAAELLHKHGYEYFFVEELVK